MDWMGAFIPSTPGIGSSPSHFVDPPFSKVLMCPSCRSGGLQRHAEAYSCGDCRTTYPFFKGIPSFLTMDRDESGKPRVAVFGKSNTLLQREADWGLEMERLVPDGKGFLLDFGCGSGKKTWCERKGYVYIPLDRHYGPNVGVLAGEGVMPLLDGSVAVCTCANVMEHVQDPWLAVREIFRVLKAGGRFVGATAFLQPYHSYSHYHMTHLGVLRMLQASGFQAITVQPFANTFATPVLRSLVGPLPPLLWAAEGAVRVTLAARSAVGKILKLLYRSKLEKAARIQEFLEEDRFRFSAGIVFDAVKPSPAR